MTFRGRRRGPLESDTCADLILPMLAAAGWESAQVVPEYAVKGTRVVSSGGIQRELPNGRVDYVLEISPGLPVAVIEAKRAYRGAADGLQQAVRYAQQLDVALAYATNGSVIIERDMITGQECRVDSVRTPAELWSRYCDVHGLDLDQAAALQQPFNRNRRDASGAVILPRYYQTVAVHRALRVITGGQRRILLLMATGTGKTFTAMQIVAKWFSYYRMRAPESNFRVLYLADMDVLLTQPMSKDFAPAFTAEALARVRGGAPMGREIYFASYQALTGGGDEEELFREYPSDFFDLLIVDECHRGSASPASSWRAVLEHFAPAVQLGLTATPKRDTNVDTYDYFGNPIFEYSLWQGIEDGFLAPYRVRRVVLSPDADNWSPGPGQLDLLGADIPEGVYGTRDFERTLSLLARTKLAAGHLSGILRVNPRARAMVFCVDQEHAEQMRSALVEANPDLVAEDPEWVVRIVGSEGERVRLLEAFCDPESPSPVVATTSKMLSTGVDVQDLRFVVLFKPVGSMVEFKQIIGRGTRLYPEAGKTFFEIIDYVGATSHFEDPAFDGYPQHVRVETIDSAGSVVSIDGEPVSTQGAGDELPPAGFVREPAPEFTAGGSSDDSQAGLGFDVPPPLPRKRYVREGDFTVLAEGHYVPDTSTGRLRLTEYAEYVANEIRSLFKTPGELTAVWANGISREDVIDVLSQHGVDVNDLAEQAGMSQADPVDVLVALAWNVAAPTRTERARRALEAHHGELAARSDLARQVLGALLDRYAENGIEDVTSGEALRLPPIEHLGSPIEIAAAFGGPAAFHAQVDELQRWLYSA